MSFLHFIWNTEKSGSWIYVRCQESSNSVFHQAFFLYARVPKINDTEHFYGMMCILCILAKIFSENSLDSSIHWENVWSFIFRHTLMIELSLIKSRDVNEPLQARGSTRSARKFRCSKVAWLEIGSKIFSSIFARLEKCSKNFGSRSTLIEIFRLEMLASLKRATLWKELHVICN